MWGAAPAEDAASCVAGLVLLDVTRQTWGSQVNMVSRPVRWHTPAAPAKCATTRHTQGWRGRQLSTDGGRFDRRAAQGGAEGNRIVCVYGASADQRPGSQRGSPTAPETWSVHRPHFAPVPLLSSQTVNGRHGPRSISVVARYSTCCITRGELVCPSGSWSVEMVKHRTGSTERSQRGGPRPLV